MTKALLLLSLLVLLGAPFIGSVALPLDALLTPSSIEGRIWWELRLPRVALGFFGGMILALGGLIFQTIFRNALMTPYTLGVSGAATLGSAAAMALGISAVALGFASAASSVLLLLLLSSRLRSAEALLLMGIALSLFYGAALMVFYHFADALQAYSLLRYTMGSLAADASGALWIIAAAASALLFWAWLWRHRLALLSLGAQSATLRGLHVKRTETVLLLLVSFAVAALISIAGPIGFVGLVVPHVVRFLYRRSVDRLIVPTALLGGIFLTAADALARALSGASGEVSVGIITALVGTPFFIFLVLRRA
ncbi:MAG: iron ABC transporter permease [Campylobacterales bacterium]|nr:iron ABC transporter permease [Campylobacterales bacterium]